MKVFFGHTMTQSSAYYRMIGYAEKMKKQSLCGYICSEYDPEKLNSIGNNFWEGKLGDNQTKLPNGLTPQTMCCKEFETLHVKGKIGLWVFQKLYTWWGLALLETIKYYYKKPIVMEIDDYMFALNTDNPNYEFFNADSENVKVGKEQLQLSTAIIVSNEYLKKLYGAFNKNIYIIPNSVDFDIWDRLKNKTHKSYINIGWEGGSGHKNDLEIILPTIKKVLHEYKNVRFTFLGGGESIPVELLSHPRFKSINKWTPINQYPKFKADQGFDIELAPLCDTQFNRAKSNLRWLEASALKIPLIASDVGEYKTTNAIKCSTDEEWYNAIVKLIKDASLRKKIGKEGYDLAKENYSMDKIAVKYFETLKQIKKDYYKALKYVRKELQDVKTNV